MTTCCIFTKCCAIYRAQTCIPKCQVILVQNISIQVIASNVEYHFLPDLRSVVYNIFCEISPPCCVRPQGTLPSKRLRRDFSSYNLYILSNAQWLGWKCGMIWCLASVEWEVVSCPSHVPVAASLPTCLPFSFWAPLSCLRVEIPADPGNVKKSINVLIPCPCPRNIDKCDIKI